MAVRISGRGSRLSISKSATVDLETADAIASSVYDHFRSALAARHWLEFIKLPFRPPFDFAFTASRCEVSSPPVTPDQLIAKWKAVELKERSAAQSHFIDLGLMLKEPASTDADPTGDWYAFERGAS
jgi:hypothetical protein